MDFQAKFTSGFVRDIWIDDAIPSRINPLSDRQQTYYLSQIGAIIEVTATVDLTVAPLDAALGGRLFYPKWLEWPPGFAPPAVIVTPGQSSVMTFSPLESGHYTFIIMRQSGGGIMIPFEVL